ncbi:MAG: hypothetical protein CL964_00815 [Euryarchaeota archaeon]|nr:hypothetical protein [Euryarchaeota archaeon]|tara:strand:- start:615 stop:881 length:267 start_codon:yes stop_codon:yes gene_type:complete
MHHIMLQLLAGFCGFIQNLVITYFQMKEYFLLLIILKVAVVGSAQEFITLSILFGFSYQLFLLEYMVFIYLGQLRPQVLLPFLERHLS